MFTPVYVNLRYWFYPIGNTPAVNLLRDTRCEGRPVKILCLGCGDPRNVLFTLWCEEGSGPGNTYEIITCDVDPAILGMIVPTKSLRNLVSLPELIAALTARNTVLLTLLGTLSASAKTTELDEKMKSMWNIFYHLYVPESDLGVLQTHAKSLLEVSETMNKWTSSQYGKCIAFLSESTLTKVRKFWFQYAKTQDLTSTEGLAFEQSARAAISSTFRKRVGTSGTMTMHGVRSAGAHFMSALRTMPEAFEGYWKTGVAGGNKQDQNSLGNDGKGRVNPMFAASAAPNGSYAVHYGSDPLLGFHLAEAFDTNRSGSALVDHVVRTAKSQFRSWCDSFTRTVEETRVRILLHCGDAISLCHELQNRHIVDANLPKIPPLRLCPWNSAPLILDRLGSNRNSELFDIIDTSNLADHLGILTLLPAVVPLLAHKPSSVLYVETLLLASEDPSQSLRVMLCSDVSTMSLLLGLCPTGHLLGVTTDCSACESLTLSSIQQPLGRQRQYLIRTSWKVPELGDMLAVEEGGLHLQIKSQVAFDAEQLASYFFSIYLKMFAYEDWGAMMSPMSLTSARRQIMSPLAGDMRYYKRLNLVGLLRLAKANVITDWGQCMKSFLDKVGYDRQLPIGANSLQELMLNLHMYGVWEDRSLKPSPCELEIAATTSTKSKSILPILFEAVDPPSVIHLALVVPRARLRVFTAGSADALGTPGLHLSVSHQTVNAENSFFAIECFFGQLRARVEDGTLCDVEEDDLGWAGSADLIVTCAVPAYTFLLGEADGVRVSLVINTSPSTTHFIRQLGLEKIVYGCSLKDKKRLWLLREAPGMNRSVHERRDVPDTGVNQETDEHLAVFAELDHNSEVKGLRFRTELSKDSDESKLLAGGAKVAITQSSPCTIQLGIGNTSPRSLLLPFPVDGTASKTRIARKSSWVEVSVPLASSPDRGGYGRNIFPIVLDKSMPLVWCMSRVNIQQQPVIGVSGDFEWLHTHMGFTLSAKQRALNALGSSNRPVDGLLDLKESLHLLFLTFVGRNKITNSKPIHSFRLVLKGNCDTLIFANAIRHDRNTSSLLMDAYVVILSHSRTTEMFAALQSLRHQDLVSINLSEAESVLWKQLIPCLVERCRQCWSHHKNCDYEVAKHIPLSTNHGESPICLCGEGKALDGFPAGRQYMGLRKYATRVAIPPIFAVPYVEPLVSENILGSARTGVGPAQDLVAQNSGVQGLEAQRTSSHTAGSTGTKCDNCGTEKQGLKACARCGNVRYCNHACQKAAWKRHKRVCKE